MLHVVVLCVIELHIAFITPREGNVSFNCRQGRSVPLLNNGLHMHQSDPAVILGTITHFRELLLNHMLIAD